jgi:hypothetical protein
MAITKEGYEEAGRKAASNGSGFGTAPEGDSWRREAWIRGYDAKIEEDSSKKPAMLTARQEHIRCLKAELSRKSITASRMLRISHKIQVLQGRENLCAST